MDSQILVFPMIPWGFMWQRPQQLLSRLGQLRHAIYYFAPTSDRAHFRRNASPGEIRIWPLAKNVFHLSYLVDEEIDIHREPISASQAEQISADLLNFLPQLNAERLNTERFVSFVQHPAWTSLARSIANKCQDESIDCKLIYDCIDEHAGFSDVASAAIEAEQELFRSADAVFATSKILLEKAEKHANNDARNVSLVQNAADFNFFKQTAELLDQSDIELFASFGRSPVIGYFGSIREWFDFELFEYLVKNRQGYQFVTIGEDCDKKLLSLSRYQNFHHLGEQAYAKLPAYLHRFDACCIPFRLIPLTEATNPVKFYEYLSAGKPVVSVRLPELIPFKDICYLADSKKQFAAALDKAIKEKSSSKEKLTSARIQTAKENSWEQRAQRVSNQIGKLFSEGEEPTKQFTAAAPKKHFEIFVLNHNGAEFLPECLESLRSLSRKDHNIYVNLIDNNSTDNSRSLVREQFPDVNLIALEENFGFSKGNNLGIRARRKELNRLGQKADYHVLLNNDTAVGDNWLTAAADAFEENPSAGIVGSKALFYDKFAAIELLCEDSFIPADYVSADARMGAPDTRELGIFLQSELRGENIHCNWRRSKLPERYALEGRGFWLPRKSHLFFAIDNPGDSAKAQFTVENHHPDKEELSFTISLLTLSGERKTLGVFQAIRYRPLTLSLNFQTVDYVELIQNAGSYVKENWEAGDRGFIQIDRGQFEQREKVDAICGVSMFIRDNVFSELGGLDEKYFAYYEDTDFSLRAKLKGHECIYEPNSVLRHFHCGSGIEHSDYFAQNVAFSQLLFASKMMKSSDWQLRLSTCRGMARMEFAGFEQDYNFARKPNLKAYCKYLKSYPSFIGNRIRNRFSKPYQRLGNGEN